MRSLYRLGNVLQGMLIYAGGDTIAALILNEFLWTRALGMIFAGGFVYAAEIPLYFRWIEKKMRGRKKNPLLPTALALLYFNPLWIARHLFFILLFSGLISTVSMALVKTAFISFAINIPVSVTANYIIQNRIPLEHRFTASAVFSALMAIYYALSKLIG